MDCNWLVYSMGMSEDLNIYVVCYAHIKAGGFWFMHKLHT